ncbi:histone deacetylase clr3 [Phellopilus nigrolimitatus]|nr:histone deacetylase clr3 [Phellopilus nigrolimitatus]
MSSLFSAVANGVSGLMKVGSQHASSATPPFPEVPDASVPATTTLEETVATSVTIESAPTSEVPDAASMDVDAVNAGAVVVNAEPAQPAAGPSGSGARDFSSAPAPSATSRASSLPVGLDAAAPRARFGYVFDERMMLHAPLAGAHPEAPARIVGVHSRLREAGCLARMKLIPIRSARKMEVLLVHSEDHWEKVMMIAAMTPEQIGMSESYYEHLSLYVCPRTTQVAMLSCGGVIEATLAVARGHLEKSFAIVRPPGHHAEPEEHMGFCFFNNVAVATRVAQQLTPMKKIMILDWDVHHGNGTQRAFLDDPSVLYISLHRYDGGRFYPCGPFGGMDSCGEGAGEGTSVNIPWPCKGMGDAEYLHAFMQIVMPIAVEFAPELVIISAGFDAADGDELGECHVTPSGYAHMTHMLSTLAGGKLVVALEGGYNVESISKSALAVTRVLLGDAPPELKPLVANETGTETVWAAAAYQSRHWKGLNPKACEPREGALPGDWLDKGLYEYAEQTISIPELLKLYRQQHLFREYRMVQVPLLDEEVDERYQAQVICSPDVMENDTLVLLIHQFGNLRVELAGALTCDVRQECSYLIDVTKELVEWVTKERGFSYVEVNTYPRPLQPHHKRSWSELASEVASYLWDNYIQLSSASKIILIGHGPGCSTVMDLMAARARSVMKKVKAVVLVVGTEDIPQVPKDDDELRLWYMKHSLVAVPQSHPFVVDGKLRKRHGKVTPYDEIKAVKLLSRALPDIQDYIDSKLSRSKALPLTATNDLNGTAHAP